MASAAPVVLVLASGRGERFRAAGGAVWKLDAPLAGKPVLEHTLDAVRASGLPFHVERGAHEGMGDSIATAVRATRDAPGWLVLPGDLPLVLPSTLRAVADALAQAEVAVPVHGGERGHPVGFAAVCGPELEILEGNHGASRVVAARAAMNLVARVEVDDVGIVTDIDTPDDLGRAEALLRAR
jgi:molybdenum cofactor cytidylyltransferase